MSSLEYRWTLPYRYEDDVLRPLVQVRVEIPPHFWTFDCLLDTGAERALLDGRVLRAAGRDIWSGNEVRFFGFMGSSAICYEHTVRIGIKDVEIDLPICFSTGPIARQVLGRDVLAHFQVGLRERYQEIYLAPEI